MRFVLDYLRKRKFSEIIKRIFIFLFYYHCQNFREIFMLFPVYHYWLLPYCTGTVLCKLQTEPLPISMRVTPPPSLLRTTYCFILILRSAYGLFSALHTVYRLTTKKTPFLAFHLHKEYKKEYKNTVEKFLFTLYVTFVVFNGENCTV